MRIREDEESRTVNFGIETNHDNEFAFLFGDTQLGLESGVLWIFKYGSTAERH